MINRSKTIAFIGICTALAMILAYIEAITPPLFAAVPGVKMGLPNIIIVFLLYRHNATTAATVSVLRIVLVSILFGNTMALLYSLAGGILSLSVMVLLRKFRIFSTVGVSVAGGVSHNIGQVLAAMVLLKTSQLGYCMTVLTVTGTIAGILIGLCGALLIKRVPEKYNL